MTPKKILVPCGPGGGDLKSVHHALALAERLQAHVLILQWWDPPDGRAPQSEWLGEALTDVIANARLAGLSLSHLTVTGSPHDEIVNIVEEESIDLLVLSADQWQLEAALLQRHPRLLGSIIRVKEKEPWISQ
ncbi:MAG: universal stress protein [Candidatus Aminicenantes bacterium]|nr:MAG: universal stress protein [Candidatus Aminicenantes bacterium]